MAEKAHCTWHEEHDPKCYRCKQEQNFRRLVQMDQEEKVCKCPILRPTPGGCPVHGG
jgi:hypothetical protein